MSTTRPRRILMAADAAGGVWTYALELSRAFRSRGIGVHLALLGPRPRPEQLAEAEALDNVTLYRKSCRLEWMEEPWDDVALSGRWLLDLQAGAAPDLVHLNGYAHAALPWGAPVVVVGHSCVLSWHEAVRGSVPFAGESRYFEAVREGLRRADAVTAPTDAMLRTLERLYGPFNAAKAIHNGRTASSFAPLTKGNIVLTAGRLWDEGKNARALAAVAHHLPWPVYAAGPVSADGGGSGETDLDGLALLGVLDHETLARWMGHASIFALPAWYEPFGLGVLEAALAGCALVLGDIPSLRELWEGAALFVSPGDREALHAALRRLIDDRNLRAALAAKARRRALGRSAERMADGYCDLYATLLAGQGVPAGDTRGTGAVGGIGGACAP